MAAAIWILDDLTPIREWSAAVAAEAIHLFAPRPAVSWRLREAAGEGPAGENPPYGALITYSLAHPVQGELRLEVLDSTGRVIRTLSSVAKPKTGYSEYEEAAKPELKADSGLQRVAWDLRYEGARRIENGMIDSGDPADRAVAPPGEYTLRLGTDSLTATARVRVTADPRIEITPEARAAQLAFALELRDALNRLADGVHRLREVRTQLRARNEALSANPAARELVQRGRDLAAALDSLESRMHNPTAEVTYDILAMKGGARLYSRLAPLYSWVVEGAGAPTQGMREVYAEQRRELDGRLAELRRLLDQDLAAINGLAQRLGIAYVVTPAGAAVP